MEFRAPTVAKQKIENAYEYLTKNLSNQEQGRLCVEKLLNELGNPVDIYPYWHPILTCPEHKISEQVTTMSELEVYNTRDHTIEFVGGFVTCPYSDKRADKLVRDIESVRGLNAYRLNEPLYADNAYPVVVQAYEVDLEADGTIRSRDAIAWFTQQLVKYARDAQDADTWWNIRPYILGCPHGARSSLFVNQHTGAQMRKILETINNSGVFGPIRESSLEMLSKNKCNKINETLIRAALANNPATNESFEFEMRGEICKATVRDTWNDGMELSVNVKIGDYDLLVSGNYYPKQEKITYNDPSGKRKIAEKFV